MITFILTEEEAKILLFMRSNPLANYRITEMIKGRVFDLDTSTANINYNIDDNTISSIKTDRYYRPLKRK
jgi:hypothetical protein